MSLFAPVICLMGPTASGKTALAIELVQQFPLEIISVDSAMVYRGMDIGTAKPSAAELKQAPHRLIDICDPAESYSAGQFCEDAKKAINIIHKNDKIPLLVGGTMLYFHLLQQGFADLPKADLSVRTRIAERAAKLGWPALHEELSKIDPKMGDQLHPNDAQRIGRALEIFQATGETLSALQAKQVWKTPPYRFLNLILLPSDRKILHERIAKRFVNMLNNGFLDEVKLLYQRKDLQADLPSIRSVGYRQAWAHLAGDYDYAHLKEQGIIATRQLAKRQLTWLKRWQQSQCFNADHKELLVQIVKAVKQEIC